MHWINKSFFAQPKKLPMGYCIWYLPPAPTPPSWGLNFSSYPPWRLLKIAFTRPDDFHKILIYPEEFSEKWKPHPHCKELYIFYSIPGHIINAKNSIFFYSISRHIVNFYNLPVTLNDPIKCNNQILLTALFFFRSWTYRPLFSMNHNSPLTLKSLLVSLLLGRPFLLLMF